MSQKPIFRLTAGGVMVALVLCLASVDRAAANPEEPSTSTSAETKPTHIMNQEITNLLKAYEKALNTSDAKAALALYGSDPIVMPQNAPAFIGREAVQAIYNHFFEILKLREFRRGQSNCLTLAPHLLLRWQLGSSIDQSRQER